MTENPRREKRISIVEHVDQIMPATGWRALFSYRRESGRVELQSLPLVAFALVKIAVRHANGEESEENYQAIIGVLETGDGVLDFCLNDDSPIRYLAPGESPDQDRKQAEEALSLEFPRSSNPPPS